MNKLLKELQLIRELNNASELYYNGKESFLTDREFDIKLEELKQLEKETNIIYSDSPTINVGAKVLTNLNKIQIIDKPMLSLDKVHSAEDIISFCNNYDLIASIKCDGLSVRLIYENGKLSSANTRGNGVEGSDITEHIKHFLNVPLEIPKKEKYIIDGEAIIYNKDFEIVNKNNEFKNNRNTASGSLTLLDMSIVKSRMLSFIAWDIIQGGVSNEIHYNFEEAKDLGFTVVPAFILDCTKIEKEEIDLINEDLLKEANQKGIPCDGVVWKINDIKVGDTKGQTVHHFLNAVAWKPTNETYSTKLITIQWTMGRTGVLTPVAIFEPIEIDGTIVSRASLHNVSIMKQILGDCAYVGEPLEVYKANMIIPQIESAGPKYDYGYVVSHGGASANDNPEICPYCGALTKIIVSADGVENMICSNDNCESKLSNKIDHFFGKKGLDAKGISKATIDKLIDWGWVSSIYDMFDLHLHKAEWIKKPGFGEKSVTKIIESISESRYCTLDKFISAIGIPLVGQTIAREIVKYYSTWNDFMDAIGGDWSEFEGFGPEISNSINEYDYTEAKKIEKILQIQYIEEKPVEIIESPVKGKTFVITGKLNYFSNRDALKTNIEVFGGKVAGSISSKTDYLINNDINSTSSKNIKAKQLNIPIITEDQYLRWVE